MSKNRTYELLDLAISCLSSDMNRLRGTQIYRTMANEALAKLTQIQLDLDKIYPSQFENANIVQPGKWESDPNAKKLSVKI